MASDLEKSPERILCLIPDRLGGVAMCTPALRTLHQRYPHAELTVAGNAAACDLLRGLPYVKRFYPFRDRPGLFRMIKIGRELRPYARDLTVVFPHSLRAAALARRMRICREVFIGSLFGGSWSSVGSISSKKPSGILMT